MDLIAISYLNIGPFKDKILNIFFDKGKYLIESPIGSGKSFLFFDGPLYALYKNTGRNVLNVNSSSGYIKLLFESQGQKYLIIRNLERGRTKDVCKSQLYTVNTKFGTQNGESKEDIEEMIKKSGANLEEIAFKNERDLDGNLGELIPPREVFLSTMFLLQDSENVFELQPADRLIVMKNIFNLIGIDEIKEKISNIRRDLQTTLKVKSDTSNLDLKIKNLVRDYIDNFTKIKGFIDIKENKDLEELFIKYKDFVQDLESIQDKVNIDEFSTEGFNKKLNESVDIYLEQQKGEYKSMFLMFENTEQKVKEKLELKNEKTKEKQSLQEKTNDIEKEIKKVDEAKIKGKKEEKLKLMSELETISKGINLEIDIPENLKNYLEYPNSIEELNNIISEAIIKGQNFSDQKTNLKLQIKNIEIKKQGEQKSLEMELKNLENNKTDLETHNKNISAKINSLEKSINEESKFKCTKINSNCPFIKNINKKTFEELEKQKSEFIVEKNNIEEKIKNINLKIQERKEDKKSGYDNQETKDLNLEIEKIQKLINSIKEFLKSIDYKNIQETYKNIRKIEQKIQILDKETMELEKLSAELDKHKNEKIKITEQINSIEKTLIDIQKELEIEQKKLETQKTNIKNFNLENINKIENSNKEMQNNIRDIQNLVNDHKENKIQINKLKQEEKMVKNLYQIFSKELLLFVMEGYLPILTEIINSFLAQVVEYTIDIKLLQKNDNLEMDVKIYDSKGERDIKSLSGGQKVILKLVWMLAISSYIKSPILFLDETINNLDNETVGKVADMLSDFVKQNDMKLYTVTHSQQIQEMDIRDKIIKIKNFE